MASSDTSAANGVHHLSLGPNVRRIHETCPALLDLLSAQGDDLIRVLDEAPEASGQPESDGISSYWHRVHLMFILRILVARTSTELASAVMHTHSRDARNISELPYSQVTPDQLSERLRLYQSLLRSVEDDVHNNTEEECAVRMAGLAEGYKLRPVDVRILQFLITAKIQAAPSVLELVLPIPHENLHYLPSSGGDETMSHPPSSIRYVCGATALDWSVLADEDHPLCKDRVVLYVQDEYGGDSRLAVSEEACRALVGWELKSEDKLKLSGTKLLKMIQPNATNDESNLESSSNSKEATSNSLSKKPSNISSDAAQDTVQEILSKLDIGKAESKDANKDPSLDEMADDDALLAALSQEDEEQMDIISKSELIADAQNEGQKQPRAYTSELDYLKDLFEIVMHQIMYSRQRQSQDLRNASLSDNKPSWMRNPLETSSKKRSVGEISAKLRLARRKMEVSLELTRHEGNFFPRLELLVEQLKLDEFEKFVLVYLAGSMISPIFKSCVQQDDSFSSKRTTVGDLLVAYFDSFAEQVSGRTYFYRSSKLSRKGLIKNVSTYIAPLDLTDQELQLDRRVLDCIVGLDKESSEVSHGSSLYEPTVSLDSVVLPTQLKETITNAVTHFAQFRAYRKRNPNFDEIISYGVGLTLMFCGKSGTGKTMTANAIAAKLGKQMLLVNFPMLHQQSAKDSSQESLYQSIFREAELSDAIIFFDECEALFSKRSNGGSSETTQLLTELERFEGIVFLATNRPFDLDESFYRRISEVFEFKAPNYLERLEIWKLVTSHEAVPCDPTIDWEAIALQYELTGGFIKNAVISALLDAVGRNPKSPLVTQSDIVNGCKKQVRGALQMVEFNERVVPQAGLNELVVGENVLEQLREMVSLEKARGILFGSWGFDNDMRARQGTTALFWGPSGTGRSRSAEAIGFELGKPLKVVDLPRLLSERKGDGDSGNAAAARNVFKEARLMDAVLVLDGFSLQTEQEGGGGTATDSRILNIVIREMTRFPGVVIMMIDTPGSLDTFVSRIDKSLIKGLKFLVEFQLPGFSNRETLWKKLMPSTLPIKDSINYRKLAESSHDFSPVQIGNAIYKAAATAALRTEAKDRFVSMKNLYNAIEEEKKRGESAVDRWVKAQYI